MMTLHFLLAVTSIAPDGLPKSPANTDSIKAILSIAFGIIGAMSLLVITISGLRYITAGGDPQRASQAKNGILFALIGLVVAISAEAIVSYVVGNL